MSVLAELSPADAALPFTAAERSQDAIFIELHTDYGYRLVTGRRSSADKPAIIGLFGFAERLAAIWAAAKSGDPYARWWLLKVEAAHRRAQQAVQSERHVINETLARWSAIATDRPHSRTPRRIELRFACPYAYWAAREIKQFDDLIGGLSRAICIGALPKSAAMRAQFRCARAMRNLFANAQGFADLALTAEAVQHGNPRAIDAATAMGPIPGDVLSGERWPVLLEKRARIDAEGDPT